MSINPAVRKLNHDLSRLRKSIAAEKKAEASVPRTRADEQKALAALKTQEQQAIDQFVQSPPTDPTAIANAFNQLFQLGEKSVQLKDRFDGQIGKEKDAIKKDKKNVASNRKQALKDLKPAEYQLSLRDTNKDRKELGLKALKKPLRISNNSKGLSKAVSIATQAVNLERQAGCYHYTQAFGARCNDGAGPLTRRGGQITFDCSGFVGAVYKAAGLPSPYTVGYTGTSFDVAGCRNMTKVSEGQAKPGDVVVFPDHIALYIGHGDCISMGQEGDPKVVSVAAEAAYHNRGIQGFYHPKGT